MILTTTRYRNKQTAWIECNDGHQRPTYSQVMAFRPAYRLLTAHQAAYISNKTRILERLKTDQYTIHLQAISNPSPSQTEANHTMLSIKTLTALMPALALCDFQIYAAQENDVSHSVASTQDD